MNCANVDLAGEYELWELPGVWPRYPLASLSKVSVADLPGVFGGVG